MKIVKLDIDENSVLAGIDAVALVEEPAIEEDFMFFNKQNFAETYTDYPEAAVTAAKQGIKRNEELGNPCATQVGKVRAQQLANREPISLDTVRRMRAFLIRQKDNYELAQSRKDYEACGYISYLLWGGPAALPWAEKKLRQAGEEFEGLDDACWPGYEAIGTKTKDGREVPNCVPKETFNEIVVEELIKQEMAAQLYDTKEEAEQAAKALGCEGAHEMGDKWMPCAQHYDEMSDEEQDAILDALDIVGISDKEMKDAGYVEMEEEAFYTEAFASITATPNKPSVADFANFSVRYRYTGPQDGRNRKFCAELMSKGLVFRKEDINNLSVKQANKEFGVYDIFRYKGSYNCRHFWQEVFYKKETNIETAKRALGTVQRGLQATTLNTPVGGTAESFAALDDQQIVVGPLMVPNKLIKRMDEDGEYYVYFTEDTIRKLAYKAMKDKIIDRVNIEHDGEDKVNAFMVESWIKEGDSDKSKEYGYSLPNGTWFAKYKIEDKDIWNDYIKSGAVKGFSVEGLFESIMLSACKTGKRCACGLSKTGVCDGSHNNK